jgi:uncharacterized membrane protein
MQISRARAGQITGGVFLIGLGLLFALGWFWPGILYLIGTTALVEGFTETEGRKRSGALQGGLFMIGMGVVFTLGFNLPLLFIILGVMTILGLRGKSSGERSERRERLREWREERRAWRDQDDESGEKLKNDALYREDEAVIDEDDGERYMLGDDGEIVKVKNDQKLSGGRQ